MFLKTEFYIFSAFGDYIFEFNMNSRNHKKVPNSVCSVNFPFQSVPGAPDSRFISDCLHGWEGSQKCATGQVTLGVLKEDIRGMDS